MARSSSGQYSKLANTAAVSGQTASSTAYNSQMDDVASALTDSLDRTGKGAMQAQFKATDGTLANPGIAFASQLNSGAYRVSDSQWVIVQNGVAVLKIFEDQALFTIGSLGTTDLVTNGDFSSFTGWSGTNWAKVSNAAKHTAGSTVALTSAIVTTASTRYKLTWTITGRTAGTVTPSFTGGTPVTGTVQSVDGTYSEVIEAASGNVAISFTPSSDFDGSLDDVAIVTAPVPGLALMNEEGTGLRGRAGLLAFVSNNIDVGRLRDDGFDLETGMTYEVGGTQWGAGVHTVNLLAIGMIARSSGGTPSAYTAERGATNPKNLAGYSFAAGANQGLQIAFPMPKSWNGGAVTFRIWWHTPTGGAGVARWRARAVCLANEDDFDSTAWSSYGDVTDTRVTGTVVQRTGTFNVTPSGTAAGENLLIVEIERNGAHADDTLGVAAVMIAAMMTYTTNTVTDA